MNAASPPEPETPHGTTIRISCTPSTYYDAKQCPLRFALSGPPPALPSAPWNIHGSVVHDLIASPPIDGDFDLAYDKRLSQLIEKSNLLQAQNPWLSTFAESDQHNRWTLQIPNFAVRRASGIALARDSARESPPQRSGSTVTRNPHEVKIERDGLVASIDLLEEENEELVITDFKTGSLYELGATGPEVKQRYRTQLLMYAAMVHAERGVWPRKWRLIGPHGERIEGIVDEIEADRLLNDCLSLRQEMKVKLEKNAEEELATGFATEACTRCSWRHRCSRTTRALGENGFVAHMEGRSTLFDIQGSVVGSAPHAGRRWIDLALPLARQVRILRAALLLPRQIVGELNSGDVVRVFGLQSNYDPKRVVSLREPEAGLVAESTTYIERVL